MGWFWTTSSDHDVMVDAETNEVIHVCDNDD